MINLMHGDCMEAMAKMPDKAYDLAIVDPPYGLQGGINRFGGGGVHTKSSVKFGSRFNMAGSNSSKKWDTVTPSTEFFTELLRVSKNWIIWGANYFSLAPCRGFIVWDKMQTVDNFSAAELAYTSFDTPSKIFQYRNHGIFRDDIAIHPTQKPIKLYEWLLKNYAKPGDRILDTHLGSGSIAIACHNMGYDLDGYELDRDYYEAACKRLADHQRQGALFAPEEIFQNNPD